MPRTGTRHRCIARDQHSIHNKFEVNAKRDHKERCVMNDFGVIKFLIFSLFLRHLGSDRALSKGTLLLIDSSRLRLHLSSILHVYVHVCFQFFTSMFTSVFNSSRLPIFMSILHVYEHFHAFNSNRNSVSLHCLAYLFFSSRSANSFWCYDVHVK